MLPRPNDYKRRHPRANGQHNNQLNNTDSSTPPWPANDTQLHRPMYVFGLFDIIKLGGTI
ncbi:hypothetical protein PGT21_023263 [Puccinia graminis f. sp. tritici]|uniref:Uncharacterized protein n=1 Tax=Puccinia graminis f. sp. tritici TaxID=56615 RepID=A0A5B0MS08_PUCGR|nr:hypothetical protein PGT21_023263 [Puccinia graminis f. sp. tritici]KAA1100781.1 hypothetical protein PGTUg99_026932 [Puccinia graminis f. sp. tritici]